jgi:hypothetical protein
VTSTITVTDNNQTITEVQGTGEIVITMTSEVNVKDSSATLGYTLTATLSSTLPANSTVQITGIQSGGASSTTNCSTSSPCNITASPITILNHSSTAATDANGHSTTFSVKITIPANTNVGNYTVDIAYDEIPVAVPTTMSGWVKSTTTLTGASTSNITVDKDANMLPVVYKTDLATANIEWANYDNKKWANAITLVDNKTNLNSYDQDGTRYTNGSGTYTPLEYYKNHALIGTEISEDDILGYWVYIPRYEYQVCRPNASDSITLSAGQCQDGNGNDVLSTATPYLFNINFQKSNQKTAFDGATVGGWATHPAFTFGNTELNGLWIGKFEASNPTTSRVAVAENIYFKPNQLGVSYNSVSDQFTMSRNIGSDGTNAHNLATLVSTMLKNDQWGAIAYLTTSVYGRGTSEMYVNNCDSDVNNNAIGGDTFNDHTGWGGASSNCSILTASSLTSVNVYNGTNGIHASTTDNVYGIYDMSGGNWEYVMGNYNQTIRSSGFSTLPDTKYYNNYPSSIFTNNSYTSNNDQCTWATCGGHALHETKTQQSVSSSDQSWGSDYSHFVGSSSPWFLRSGSPLSGSSAGVFASNYYDGYGYGSFGFRVVLGPF